MNKGRGNLPATFWQIRPSYALFAEGNRSKRIRRSRKAGFVTLFLVIRPATLLFRQRNELYTVAIAILTRSSLIDVSELRNS